MSELLVAIMLVATGFLFSLELRRRKIAETQLQDTLASVEQQVAQRTAELSRAMAELRISEQQAESAKRAAEDASQLKDEFLSTASHELRTPLNAIVGWVHVLKTEALDNDEQRRQAVAAIDRNAKIQTRLIEDLLDVSRMIQGRVTLTVEPVDLRAIVDAAVETVRPAALAKEIAIGIEGGAEALTVLGDEHRLRQVACNVLTNAIKFTPNGGRVTVTTMRQGHSAMFRVADTGEGIAPEFLPHIFEPFRQGASKTMRTGLGLGLAIVSRVVELHGGQISAVSEGRGSGASFTITVPLAHGAASEPIVKTSKLLPDFHHLHVIVAEDDADSAAAVTAILRLHGCVTQIARSASECVRLSTEWPPDVLICDVGLPDDDGYGLLRRIRSLPHGANIPAIALTAYARPEDRVKALAAGFRAHLSKPLDPENLLREISEAVKGKSAA